MEKTKKGDFVEIEFTGYANGIIFDSNIPEDLKKISSEAEPKKFAIAIGRGMAISGFDKALEEKEVGKKYEIDISYNEGFGERKKELVKTLPLNVFTKQKINPQPGMVLHLDNNIAKIIAVSGARVITDFNNPLAGKDLHYKFKIKKILVDEKEKAESLFLYYLGFAPEFEVSEKIIVKGAKELENIVSIFSKKFKEILGKEIEFKIEEKEEIKPQKNINTSQGTQ